MNEILSAPWMTEMIRTTANMYDHGWDERNGGNISLMLDESAIAGYTDGATLRTMPTGFSCPELDGKHFLVTGTGKYFKNIQYDPARNLGLVRLTAARRRSFSGDSQTAAGSPRNFPRT